MALFASCEVGAAWLSCTYVAERVPMPYWHDAIASSVGPKLRIDMGHIALRFGPFRGVKRPLLHCEMARNGKGTRFDWLLRKTVIKRGLKVAD